SPDQCLAPWSVSGTRIDCSALTNGQDVVGAFAGAFVQPAMLNFGDSVVTSVLALRAGAPDTPTLTPTPTRTVPPSPSFTPTPPCSPGCIFTPTPSSTASPSPRMSCVGDCNGDGRVTIDELIRGVNIALNTISLAQCPSFDIDGSLLVTVTELVTGVHA